MAEPGRTGPVTFEREKGVYEVRITTGVAHAVVVVGQEADKTERVLGAFRKLAERGIPIFLIKLHSTAVSFAVAEGHVAGVESCLRDVARESRVRRDLALVTIIATSMRDLTGVMSSIADSLGRAGARLYGVGDSHNSVQCLVDGPHAEPSACELRRTFRLETPHG
jgi:aspartate kinase